MKVILMDIYANGNVFRTINSKPAEIVICDVASAILFKQRRRKTPNPIPGFVFLNKSPNESVQNFAKLMQFFSRNENIFILTETCGQTAGSEQFSRQPRIKLFRVVKILS